MLFFFATLPLPNAINKIVLFVFFLSPNFLQKFRDLWVTWCRYFLLRIHSAIKRREKWIFATKEETVYCTENFSNGLRYQPTESRESKGKPMTDHK